MSQFSRGGGTGRGFPGQGVPRDRPGGPDPRERSLTDLWPGYLEGGYFDDQGCLKIEYVSREKVEPLVKAMCESSPRLTTHQIRRYFGHCRAVETRLKVE